MTSISHLLATMKTSEEASTHLSRALDWFFDALPLRRMVGVAALAVGILNILEPTTVVANILTNIYGIHAGLIVAYMSMVSVSGAVLLFSRTIPHWRWFIPMVTFTMITPIGYITGSFRGANTFFFGLKALCSVGLAWYLLIRAIRQGDNL